MGMNKKENPFAPYELQFDVKERKAMVAEMITQLRKSTGYQQKEVASLLGISPQTYNGYEKGRNEPPIEILVRISFLYNMPMDILTQRDRQHKDGESALLTIARMDEEMEATKAQLRASPYANNEQLNTLVDSMQKMSDMLKMVVSEAEEKK